MKNTENGRSMIEMLGVLAIIGVLSVGGIAGYSKAMMKYRVNKTIEQFTLIAGNLRSFFKNDYRDLSTDDTGRKILKKAKLVPDEMWHGNEILNQWGITIYINGSEPGDDYKFTFMTWGIPQEACIEILSQDLTTMGVSDVYGGCGPEENFSYKTPLSIEDAINACTMCDGNPDIYFYFD